MSAIKVKDEFGSPRWTVQIVNRVIRLVDQYGNTIPGEISCVWESNPETPSDFVVVTVKVFAKVDLKANENE